MNDLFCSKLTDKFSIMQTNAEDSWEKIVLFNIITNPNYRLSAGLALKKQPKISVIGTGYVGLCTAVGFASKGYNVLACDVDEAKIEKINQGIPPFHEPGLQEKLSESLAKGNLKGVVGQTDRVVGETDLTFVAVGTPSRPDGSIDLQYIESAASNIGKALKQKDTYHVTIIKSTVVPGTTQDVVKPVLETRIKEEMRCRFWALYEPRVSAARLRFPGYR